MSHPPPRESDDKAVENVELELNPMERFRTLAERLLSVGRKELAEQEKKQVAPIKPQSLHRSG